MMDGILPVLATRKRMLDHIVGQIRSHVWIHVAAGLFTLLMIVGGGGGFFYLLFRFLLKQEPFGPPLMERLVGIVLLTFFSMLIFSNLIITLTTTYISRETEFLIGLPLPHRGVFAVKLTESIFFSSWAFVVLSLPLFASYGFAKHAPVWFYPTAFLLGLPFLVIPAAIGAMLTMVLSAYLPARKARIYSLALLAASLGVTAVVVKMMGLRSMVMQDDDFTQIMRLLNAGTIPILPNTWLARGVQAASEARYGEAGYWFLCLLSTALVSVQACLWMVPPLYYRGWSLAKECASPTLVTGRRSLFPLLDNLFRPFSPPVRALLAKDMRTFWRDPAQWSQLIILFGLLVIYIANIRGLSRQLRGIEFFLKQWPIVLSFFNMGATCFVLSILTTRFIFPMLSLEGKQYWVIGLAPFPKQRLVWQKYCLCLAGCIVIAISLIFFSNTVLNVTPVMAWLGLATVFVMGFGLTSLAVGLGAMYPSFKEDNPARIANGLGGTMAIVASLFYISATIALEIPPAFHLANHSAAGIATPGGLAGALLPMWHYFAGLVLLNAVVIVLPMWLGVRNWLRLEFHL